MNIFKQALYALCFLSITQSKAQSLEARLEASFQQLAQDPQTKYGTPSLTVLDANSGKIIFAKNEDVGLAPASTLKTIVAATAYHILGKDFTYKTDIKYTGETDLIASKMGAELARVTLIVRDTEL